ncbi:PREDICTED: uncharacterized protein LOC104725317 [Camelina sativa]|uniref:Uncharacterized protein LOC104725317 n=1 Tax=Camelina sativa TaxID=90675 RepID=A0ABM0UJZ5_CAMSA|nr:PREDICTED: uncharacterized protein LOC104725317 [Camelina sativa]XP_010442252.1 PREDICTED: uncharacterized protein LOC104725317 [Camelina sativa]
MMENPNSSSMVDSTSSAPKRYTPPNQRNRSSNRRRSIGSFSSNEGERSQPVSVAVAVGFQKENSSSPKIISLAGCSNSEAFHLLSDRWAAAMHLYSDPTVDLSERPLMYYGGDVWGKLPH